MFFAPRGRLMVDGLSAGWLKPELTVETEAKAVNANADFLWE